MPPFPPRRLTPLSLHPPSAAPTLLFPPRGPRLLSDLPTYVSSPLGFPHRIRMYIQLGSTYLV